MLEQLKSILSKVDKKLNMDAITEETNLINDLKLDSLAMMLFAMEIEVAFNFRFTEPVKFETVGDVCRYLENRK
jgi:acyl carrier protein